MNGEMAKQIQMGKLIRKIMVGYGYIVWGWDSMCEFVIAFFFFNIILVLKNKYFSSSS